MTVIWYHKSVWWYCFYEIRFSILQYIIWYFISIGLFNFCWIISNGWWAIKQLLTRYKSRIWGVFLLLFWHPNCQNIHISCNCCSCNLLCNLRPKCAVSAEICCQYLSLDETSEFYSFVFPVIIAYSIFCIICSLLHSSSIGDFQFFHSLKFATS